MPAEFTLPSYAKINWFLRILGKRADGYHELCTLFQTISLHDRLSFSEYDSLLLECEGTSVPTGNENLIIRAAKALQYRFNKKNGARILLDKRIPSPGGLGGGSSNAAVALIGLRKLWNLDASAEELSAIGAEIGSDVPFFLHGGTAIGTGRGEIIESTSEIREEFMLVVTPNVAVSTRDAFAEFDALNLTMDDPESILRVCRFTGESRDLRNKTLINDFESSVFPVHPEIARVKNTLLGLGARQALMSGSGASVFAIFDKEETRQTALKALDIESTWRKFAVATISRSKYREALHLAY